MAAARARGASKRVLARGRCRAGVPRAAAAAASGAVVKKKHWLVAPWLVASAPRTRSRTGTEAGWRAPAPGPGRTRARDRETPRPRRRRVWAGAGRLCGRVGPVPRRGGRTATCGFVGSCRCEGQGERRVRLVVACGRVTRAARRKREGGQERALAAHGTGVADAACRSIALTGVASSFRLSGRYRLHLFGVCVSVCRSYRVWKRTPLHEAYCIQVQLPSCW